MLEISRTALAVAALAVLLAGCSSDDGNDDAASQSTATTAAPTVEGFCAAGRDPSDPDDLLATYEDLLDVAPPEVASDLQALVDATRELEEIDGDEDTVDRQIELATQIDESSANVAAFVALNCDA